MAEPFPVEAEFESPVEAAIERARLIEQMLLEDKIDAAWDYYLQLHPSDRAEALTELRGRLRRFLAADMAPETVAGLLEYLDPRISARMLREYQPTGLAEVLDLADPAAAAELLGQLPEERRMATISAMAASSHVERLLRYEDGSAGRLIDP